MMYSQEQVEWIVAEVIRRLQLLPATAHGTPAGVHSTTAPELKLTERVITLRTVEGKLKGVTRLVVPPRAVVTPAVKDELKLRKIELVTSAGG